MRTSVFRVVWNWTGNGENYNNSGSEPPKETRTMTTATISDDAREVVAYLRKNGRSNLYDIQRAVTFSDIDLARAVLELELNEVIHAHAGKEFSLTSMTTETSTSKKAYKWANPQEWLQDYINGLGYAELLQEARNLASMLDSDQIQDTYQSDMDAQGYFGTESEDEDEEDE